MLLKTVHHNLQGRSLGAILTFSDGIGKWHVPNLSRFSAWQLAELLQALKGGSCLGVSNYLFQIIDIQLHTARCATSCVTYVVHMCTRKLNNTEEEKRKYVLA